ncbi:hypothetical protein [Arcticibacter tournemirensis]|uniref:Uncharacterized protein n=1 Tax=Arcticibacter tournemirensis TaxID=699437 RepID=A0A4Q0M6K0_9SPHI|nr:hypothetical protein [Arcticibacter tournemirensis]RXF68688.1 hypothetical protein EKH83_15285 [Arcticibacter tournemirensis]
MEKIKQIQKWVPELYLIASVIFYWASTFLLNPVAIILLLILALLIFIKSEILGVVISFLFLMLNLYMVLALISELNEFPAFNKDAKIMLLVGGGYLGLNITLSIAMLIKWGKKISSNHTSVDVELTNS